MLSPSRVPSLPVSDPALILPLPVAETLGDELVRRAGSARADGKFEAPAGLRNPDSVGGQIAARLSSHDLTRGEGRMQLHTDLSALDTFLGSKQSDADRKKLFESLGIRPPLKTEVSVQNAEVVAGMGVFFNNAARQGGTTIAAIAAMRALPGIPESGGSLSYLKGGGKTADDIAVRLHQLGLGARATYDRLIVPEK